MTSRENADPSVVLVHGAYADGSSWSEVIKRLDQAGITAQVHEIYASRPGVTSDDLDGLTVQAPDWWFNLRPSNTEPLLRLNVEAADQATMESLRDEVLGLVRGTPGRER